MKTTVSLILAFVVSIYFDFPGRGQTPPRQQQDEVIRVQTNEVKLDVVVKDKKGRPVKTLTAADFEIYEDGVRQGIESFSFQVSQDTPGGNNTRSGKEGTAQPAPASTATRNITTPEVIALVFDRLSPEARALARKAGMAYAQEGMVAGDFTGVFGIDQSLRTIQPFTENPDLVKQGIDRATSTSTSTYSSNAGKMRDLSERSMALDQKISSAASEASAAGAERDGAGASAAGAASGQAAAEQKFIEMEVNMHEQFEVLERDQQGFATINSLLAVINPMQNLPGRKTLVFFSEGLVLPSSVQAKFPSVISAANRANVSIYAIDSAGLRIESGTSEAARELNSIASRRMQQNSRGNDSGTSGPYTKTLERNEDLLRFDPRSGLGTLADETGGFLIHDTNDLVSGLHRINEDMRGYYMIRYIPKNKDFDGRFRQISVKLTRPNLEVQTRKGYYAVESLGQLPVLDYEAPAIAAARNAHGKSNPFSFMSSALSFPAANRPGLTLIIAEAPISAFSFAPAPDKKTYTSDFSIVALVKDESEQVVQKLSQHYSLSVPIDQLESARKSELIFYREAQLAPGTYAIELIAFDRSTGKLAIQTRPLEIPVVDNAKLRLSSVAVLKRAERLMPEEQKQDQPFHFGELLVYPNLGEPIFRSAAKQLAFFFTAWPANGSTAALTCTVEILQNNRRLSQTSTQLPTADAQGQIKYASTFPLDKFQPGVYELKITVVDGKDSISRATQFAIAP
jgi:VWFA-related protein